MTEDEAKRVFSNPHKATYDECKAADEWLKDYVLRKFKALAYINASHDIAEYATMMVSLHFGSGKTDAFLEILGCYPSWLKGPHTE